MEIPFYDQDPTTDELMEMHDREDAALEEHLASRAIADGIHELIALAATDASYGELQHAMSAFFAPTTRAAGRRAR